MNFFFYILSAAALAVFGVMDIISSQWFGEYDFDNPATGNRQRNFEANKLFQNADGTLNNPRAIAALIFGLLLQFFLFYFGGFSVQIVAVVVFGIWGASRLFSALRNFRQKEISQENYGKYLRGEI